MVIEFGEETRVKMSEAITFFRKSAVGGDPFGQCALGIQLAGMKQFGEAFELFQRAVDQNDPGGYFNIGCCFVRGEGTNLDLNRGYECFKKCCELGGLYWETKGSQRLCYRRSAGLNLIDLSQSFKQESASDVSAAVNYAWCQYLGSVIPKDALRASHGFRAAAEQKHSGGMFSYGIALSDGGLTQNADATHWFVESALWNPVRPASTGSSKSNPTLVKPAKRKVTKPRTGKQNFMVPGNWFEVAKEQKEGSRQVKRGHI
jgi:TPR repeat protein